MDWIEAKLPLLYSPTSTIQYVHTISVYTLTSTTPQQCTYIPSQVRRLPEYTYSQLTMLFQIVSTPSISLLQYANSSSCPAVCVIKVCLFVVGLSVRPGFTLPQISTYSDRSPLHWHISKVHPNLNHDAALVFSTMRVHSGPP